MAIKTAIRLAGKHPFFWVALLAGVLLLGFYVFAGLMIFRYGTLSKDFGWEYSSRGDNWYVSEVDQRRRIKWIVYGTAAGALPGVAFFLSFVILSRTQSSEPLCLARRR